jgi:hypothetical protein
MTSRAPRIAAAVRRAAAGRSSGSRAPCRTRAGTRSWDSRPPCHFAPAYLHRYVDTREDLLDLMIDATGSEYVFAAPTGDWLADLLDIGEQARAIMRRHPWLPSLLITRSVLGPNGLVLLEHVLKALAPHPASLAATHGSRNCSHRPHQRR